MLIVFFFLEIVNKKLKNIPGISCAVGCETDGIETESRFFAYSRRNDFLIEESCMLQLPKGKMDR